MWEKVVTRNDLGDFLLNLLSSPYSEQTPILILGHPGAGKSLLTNMLAARIPCSRYAPIRLELRNINADNEIAVQIEEQLRRNTAREVRWSELLDYLDGQPPLLLLDGYDELLRARGKTFAGYLLKVQKFQENEQNLGHKPVRAIITSRISLISEARVPRGTVVLRLLEFDETQRNKWISIWNRANEKYFADTHTDPFTLPTDNNDVTKIASEPLLLLMLAIYDADSNPLRRMEQFDRTILYDSVLRRFVSRERQKQESFALLSKDEQQAAIDLDMKALGIAAMGMLNRQSLFITKKSLDVDLQFFLPVDQAQPATDFPLTHADQVVGSFFFIHKSASRLSTGQQTKPDSEVTYEFLHNTFGEFLAADLLLRKLIAETDFVRLLMNPVHGCRAQQEKITVADWLPKDWFALLMHTPLLSRPVVLQMMREWLPHCLQARDLNEFIVDLDIIVVDQIRRLLLGSNLPIAMTETSAMPYPKLPILGYVACYSLNLVALRAVLSPDGWIFPEKLFPSPEDVCSPWYRLVHLWRTWFPLKTLIGYSEGLATELVESIIHLHIGDALRPTQKTSPSDLPHDDEGRRLRANNIHLIEQLEDITSRFDELPALFSEFNQMKSNFVANVSHELRTPLTSIKGFIRTLIEDTDGYYEKEMQQEFYQIIDSECDRLVRLISDLLNVSRIESGRALELVTRPVQLPALIERHIVLKRSYATKHDFKIDCPKPFPDIIADSDKVEQILSNLLSNAVKFSPDGGVITVTARDCGDFVAIDISDNGVGIPAEDLDRIFTRFYSSRRHRMGGSGIGLYLVKHLVEAHGGKIEVKSMLDKGSTFTFFLPIKPEGSQD
jgi:signal transduction histidine kinase